MPYGHVIYSVLRQVLRLRSLRTAHFVARGCRPFSTENEHTGSFSGRFEPQDDNFIGSKYGDAALGLTRKSKPTELAFLVMIC